MKKSTNTKRALLMSVLSMMLCMAMLIGSTFAWFTDSVTSGMNKIVAGNLDIELEYATEFNEDGSVKTWTPVTSTTKLFSEFEEDGKIANLWEPGHTEYVCLRVRNAGTLALKYHFAVNVWADENGTMPEKNYINKDGGEFKLSDYLVFRQIPSAKKVDNREDLWIKDPAAEELAMGDLSGLGLKSDKMLSGEEKIVTLAVYMPTQVGNEANYKAGTDRPEIYLGLSVVATQTPYEKDSFNEKYDDGVEYFEIGSSERVKYLVNAGYTEAKTFDALSEALNSPDVDKIVISEDLFATSFIAPDKDLTIDLNGNSLTTSGNRLLITGEDKKLVVKNGDISSSGNGMPALNNNGGELILENVDVTAPNYYYGVYSGGQQCYKNCWRKRQFYLGSGNKHRF